MCFLLNSSDFIFESFFAFVAVTSFCLIGISKVGWVKTFANSTGSSKWSLGWVEEDNSRSWCGHRKVRVRKYDSGWKLAGCPWSFYTHCWRAGAEGWFRVTRPEVWATQWMYVPETLRHFLRLGASWLFLLWGKLMINTLWVVAYPPSSVESRQSPTAVLDIVMPKALARWSVTVSVWFAFASVLTSCSHMQTLRTF